MCVGRFGLLPSRDTSTSMCVVRAVVLTLLAYVLVGKDALDRVSYYEFILTETLRRLLE